MRGRMIVMLVALAAAGCTIPKEDLPAGWVTPDKVIFSNAERIKIEWDNLQTNEAAVRQKAVAHCGGEVEEIDASRDVSTFGLIRTKTWRCLAKK